MPTKRKSKNEHKTYQVYVAHVYPPFVVVTAKSKEEAKLKGLRKWHKDLRLESWVDSVETAENN